MADQRARAGQIGHIGVLLVREHGVAGEAEFLRALDLAVPIGALDQANHEANAVAARNARHFVDQRQRACLVGLHRESEAAPLREVLRDARGQGIEHIEREFEAVALFGIDRQIHVGARGRLDQAPHARQQLRENTLALRILVAREEGAELDRDAIGLLR